MKTLSTSTSRAETGDKTPLYRGITLLLAATCSQIPPDASRMGANSATGDIAKRVIERSHVDD
jgi:hypothetical protein